MSLIFFSKLFKISNTIKVCNNDLLRSISFVNKPNSNKAPDISPYEIRRAYPDEFPEILKEMHTYYYAEEPTCTSLNICPNQLLDDKVLKAMQEGFTLIAKCKCNDQIVGACINQSTNPWDVDEQEKLACTTKCENVRKLLMFYAYLMRTPNLFECLGVNQIYEMSYIFINKLHRKQGLAYGLLKESKSLGEDSGYSVIRCDATSNHTAKICECLGMKKIAEIPYCTYVDQNLNPIFKPPWPHESVKIYCDCSSKANKSKRKMKDKKKL